MAAANKLAAELAFKANVDAVSRDYVCEPHLGRCPQTNRGRDNMQITRCSGTALVVMLRPLLRMLQSTAPFLV
jgi:hypothetical protein